MPVSQRELYIAAPMEKVWDFVSTLDNVAMCMPGYQRHEVIDERESVWYLKGDVGLFQKVVAFVAHIERMDRAEGLVSFTLAARDENMKGEGCFRAWPEGEGVVVQLELKLEGGGLKGPLVNALLSSTLPDDLEYLGDRLKEVLERDAAVGQ